MPDTTHYLLLTAAFSLLLSLGLAWLASLILYLDIQRLKRIFPASHQLIRAHIDYILMCLLLIACYYLNNTLNLKLPDWAIYITCLGALYNPFGFIVLAVKPHMAKPKTVGDKARILIGFLPATLGYGYIMCATLASLM